MRQSPEVEVVGRKACWRFAPRALDLGAADHRGDHAGDRPADFVLQFEDVRQVAIVTIGPDLHVAATVGQFGRHANAIANLAHAAAQHVLDTEFLRDLPMIHTLALETEARTAGDNYELMKAPPG